jgi:hypothetical protein
MTTKSFRFLSSRILCMATLCPVTLLATLPKGIFVPKGRPGDRQGLLAAHMNRPAAVVPKPAPLTPEEHELLWNIQTTGTFLYKEKYYVITTPPVTQKIERADNLNHLFQTVSDDNAVAIHEAELGKRFIVGQTTQKKCFSQSTAFIGLVVARMAINTPGVPPSSNGYVQSFRCHREMTADELSNAIPRAASRSRWWSFCCCGK